jgi:hypothetical protein
MRWFAGPGRLARGLWPDRNPLRRRSDRAEAVFVALLLAGLLAGVPAAALTAGSWTYGAGVRVEQSQQAGLHQVQATLLEAAPAALGQQVLVQARWTAPDGVSRTGQVTVLAAGMPAGSRVPVWTDASGRLHASPLRHSTVSTMAVLVGIWAAIIACLLLAGAWRLADGVLRRRRMAAWEADWRTTAPRWTSRR